MQAFLYRTRLGTLLAMGVCFLAFSFPVAAQSAHPISLGAGYTYVRTNILPGCNCTSLQGGVAQLQYSFVPHFAALADFTAVHGSGITPDSYSLTQFAYTFGVRYWPAKPGTRLSPFAEALGGVAHASGTLSPASTGLGSSTAGAFQTGGGLDVKLSDRFTIVPAEIDYLMTTFNNGALNRQNDFKFVAGVRFQLRK